MIRRTVLLGMAWAEPPLSPRCLSIMAQRDEKRKQRQLKREIKKAGNKRRRQHLKRDLERNPEEAASSEFDFGNLSSETLNGLDQDATRRKKSRTDQDTPAD